jgi:hypothetical protein
VIANNLYRVSVSRLLNFTLSTAEIFTIKGLSPGILETATSSPYCGISDVGWGGGGGGRRRKWGC